MLMGDGVGQDMHYKQAVAAVVMIVATNGIAPKCTLAHFIVPESCSVICVNRPVLALLAISVSMTRCV